MNPITSTERPNIASDSREVLHFLPQAFRELRLPHQVLTHIVHAALMVPINGIASNSDRM